jgi:hypothetical protein
MPRGPRGGPWHHSRGDRLLDRGRRGSPGWLVRLDLHPHRCCSARRQTSHGVSLHRRCGPIDGRPDAVPWASLSAGRHDLGRCVSDSLGLPASGPADAFRPPGRHRGLCECHRRADLFGTVAPTRHRPRWRRNHSQPGSHRTEHQLAMGLGIGGSGLADHLWAAPVHQTGALHAGGHLGDQRPGGMAAVAHSPRG